MEIRQLRYLLTIAEEQNFTRAAEKLYVSQPALTQQIQKLEEEVGDILLDRAQRQIRLTPAGSILCETAQRILQELVDAKVALDELAGLQRGEIRVGVVQTVNAYLIPEVVSAFKQTYPGIQIQVEELPAEAIEAGLLKGDLQIGLSFIPTDLPNLATQTLFEEELILITKHDHPLANHPSLNVADLANVEMVLLSSAYCTRRLWDKFARDGGLVSQISIEMNTIGSVLNTVAQTSLVTVLPQLALANAHFPNLVGIPLMNPTPRRRVGLLWRTEGYRCQASQAFAEMVLQISTTKLMSV